MYSYIGTPYVALVDQPATERSVAVLMARFVPHTLPRYSLCIANLQLEYYKFKALITMPPLPT